MNVESLASDTVVDKEDELRVQIGDVDIQYPVLGFYITYINHQRTVVLRIADRNA